MIQQKLNLIAIAFICSVSVVNCSKEDSDGVAVASSKDWSITDTILKREAESSPGGKQRAAYPGGYQAILNRIIDLKIAEQEGKKRNIYQSKEYQEAIEVIRNRAAREEREMVYRMLFEDISKQIQISNEDLKKYYEQSKGRFLSTSLHLERISVKTQEQAKSIKQQLNKGKDFAKLAGEYNTDESLKSKRGDMGILMRSDVPRSLRVAAFGLKNTGDVSEPFSADGTWNLLKLVSRESAVVRPFENVKQQLEEELRRKKASELMQALMMQKRKDLKVEINMKELAKLGPMQHPQVKTIAVPALSRPASTTQEAKKLIDRGGH